MSKNCLEILYKGKGTNMTLNEQRQAAIAHRDTDMLLFDDLILGLNSHKETSYQAHQNAIAVIDAQIEAHMAFIGEAA